MVSDEEETQMALTGLKPPGPLSLDGNLALNWKEWFNAYEIYATAAAGVSGKSERVQCCVFLHVAGREAQKLDQTSMFEPEEKDKYTRFVEAFRSYCQGKDIIIVVQYRFNMFKQTTEGMETFIRELEHRVS